MLTSRFSFSSFGISVRRFSSSVKPQENKKVAYKDGDSIGMIGLGKIGYAMANNFIKAGYNIMAYDVDSNAIDKLLEVNNDNDKVIAAKSAEDVSTSSKILITVLPNDTILKQVHEKSIINYLNKDCIHISMSTISPYTSRYLSKLHEDNNSYYISAPVFARPDGMSKRQSTIVISGHTVAFDAAKSLLQHTSTKIYEYGSDAGAANIVKLCGNYCIASSIETISESLILAEKNGIPRNDLMKMLSETIFNCLIYNGYGQRIANHDYTPYENAHFSLELGHKDINLVLSLANQSETPLPIANILHDRFKTSLSKHRNSLDWSAIALNVSENAGINVDHIVEKCINNSPQTKTL